MARCMDGRGRRNGKMEQDLPQRHVFFNFVPFFWEDAWIEIDFYCGRFQAPVLKKIATCRHHPWQPLHACRPQSWKQIACARNDGQKGIVWLLDTAFPKWPHNLQSTASRPILYCQRCAGLTPSCKKWPLASILPKEYRIHTFFWQMIL